VHDSASKELRVLFNVPENVPVGTFVGVIQSNDSSVLIEPPFLIVPSGDSDSPDGSVSAPSDSVSAECNVDTELNIDQSTGEIRSAVELDRERCSHYTFVAISLSGVNVHVNIVSAHPPLFTLLHLPQMPFRFVECQSVVSCPSGHVM